MINIEAINKLVNFISSNKLKIRVNDTSDTWFEWLTIPVEGYIDFGLEPIPFSELNTMEIQTYYIKNIGNKIPHKKISVRIELLELLQLLTGIYYQSFDSDEIIRIVFKRG